jgi:hypothetical protein
MDKLQPLIAEEVKENFKLSYLYFKDAVADNVKQVSGIVKELDGNDCSNFCEMSKRSQTAIQGYEAEYLAQINLMNTNQVTFDEIHTEVNEHIFPKYQHEVLFWFKIYYTEMKARTEKEMNANQSLNGAAFMGGTGKLMQDPKGISVAQTFDFSQIKKLAAGFEYNDNYKKSKAHVVEAKTFMDFLPKELL